MSRYRLAPRAARDLDHIIDELDRRSLTAGDRVASAFREKSGAYALHPELGIIRDDLSPDLRCFLVFSYVAFYRQISGGIEIARIFHGHQAIDPDMFLP
jgi:plasmid stabilization system protein ParE